MGCGAAVLLDGVGCGTAVLLDGVGCGAAAQQGGDSVLQAYFTELLAYQTAAHVI